MDKQTVLIIAVLIALVAGFGGGYTVRGSQTPEAGEHMMQGGMMMNNGGMGMGSAMDDMMAGLSGKSGDEFDKAFLSQMIMHHQGAVQMAQAALQSAKHQEIKDMAKAIISAQTTEINQMQMWGKSWYNQ
jgi:uncharacterized protein (DUF305 family)